MTERVHYRDGNDYKQIGHLADRHCLRTIAYHAEDSKQTEHETGLNIKQLHQPEEQEHCRREKHKSAVIVTAMTYAVIDEVYYYPGNKEVEKKHYRQRDETFAYIKEVGKRVHQIRDTV